MDDRIKKAFDFASDSTKQLITLSTAIVTLTITFAHNILGDVNGNGKTLLSIAWIIYLISIICGVWTLLALTGTLEPVAGDKTPASIRGRNVTLPSILQILSFLVATGVIVLFGITALG